MNSSRDNIIEINPSRLSDSDNPLIFRLLDENLKNGKVDFLPSTDYPLSSVQDGGEEIIIRLTHSVIGRKRKTRFEEYTYDIYSDVVLGKGKQGSVIEISGNLKFGANQRVVYKDTQSLVAKLEKHENETRAGYAKNEYKFLKKMQGAKSITFFSDEYSYMVMYRIIGKNLENILKKDKENKINNINEISTNTRITLTIQILIYLSMIHDNNILHRDIKPENMMVTLNEGYVNANIFDFGLSCNVDNHDGRYVGTPLFLSPEVFDKKPATKKSDIFGAGWVLALIFRADSNPSTTVQDAFEFAHNCELHNLFNGIDDLDITHKMKIENILKSMLHPYQYMRSPIQNSIRVLEKVLLERLLASVELNKQESFYNSFIAGAELRMEYADLRTTYKNLSKVKPEDFEELEDIFFERFDIIPNDENMIRIFIERANINALKGLITRKEVEARFNKIISRFDNNRVRLEQLEEEISKRLFDQSVDAIQRKNLSKLFNDITRVRKIEKCPYTIDNLAKIGDKYKKNYNKFKSRFDTILPSSIPKEDSINHVRVAG